ncbi:MAG: chemotaxis-specific protein-glutamate methyltransferase CheB [Sandaracinus sp.]|nr:chemotaxis-specific protein-glutamate methyltransferase CheB [Sandaracinus sp.]MCB9623978.1 chemotaxis-specific protein-glutamate methyltransferase CheB [Sandaracinus sp.]MCB9632500.1 chemotaxis-specific protein-glutamate methyltransferase CheB [Sandaracinus sp.]
MTIRVLIADDSVVMRRMLSEVLASIPDVDVVGTASSGEDAVEKAHALRPDFMTCDIVMGAMDGIETVRALRGAGHTMPIVMVSSLSTCGAEATLASLAAGADDYVCKPRGTGGAEESRAYLRTELRARLSALTSRRPSPRTDRVRATLAPPPTPKETQVRGTKGTRGTPASRASWEPAPLSPGRGTVPPAPRVAAVTRVSVVPPRLSTPPSARASTWPSTASIAPQPRTSTFPVLRASAHPGGARSEAPHPSTSPAHVPTPSSPPSLLVIGSSTGGPSALQEMLTALGRDFPAPVLVVQHMPPLFTSVLADRLARETGLNVVEAKDGMPLTRGGVLIAPGGRHLVVGKNTVQLIDGPPENNSRPSVDVLFRSATLFGAGVTAVVLTGMGRDGLEGARALKQRGATVLVQSEATSVVWGMPGHVARAGLADGALAPSELGALLRRWGRLRRTPKEAR